jgi:hypothetical protein
MSIPLSAKRSKSSWSNPYSAPSLRTIPSKTTIVVCIRNARARVLAKSCLCK